MPIVCQDTVQAWAGPQSLILGQSQKLSKRPNMRDGEADILRGLSSVSRLRKVEIYYSFLASLIPCITHSLHPLPRCQPSSGSQSPHL